MPILSQPSSAARTALAYITLGALLIVWTGVWWWYLHTKPAEEVLSRAWYICYGLMFTGVTLFVIGLAVGHIGRSARHAELPPPEVMAQEAKLEQMQAAQNVTAPVATPAAPAVPPPPAVPANPPLGQPVATVRQG
jgi:hypothetical protein